MVVPERKVNDQDVEIPGTESDSPSELDDTSNLLNQFEDDAEQEYHTEESDADDEEELQENEKPDSVEHDEPSDSELDLPAAEPPLLPTELLKPLPSPANSMWNHINIPWDRMTRKQKRTERNRTRKAAKRQWDQLRYDAMRTGAIQAGKVAQARRGIVPSVDKVRRGRVEKQRKPEISGRQKVLEDRKRSVQQSRSELMKPSKKAKKTQPKR